MIDGLEPAPKDPLADFRAKVIRECGDENITDETLATVARPASYTHVEELGHLAEFWLLLSLLEAVSHPREAYSHYAGVFRDKAKQCEDVTSDLCREYGRLADKFLHDRGSVSDQRRHVAARFVKHHYDALAKQLEPVH